MLAEDPEATPLKDFTGNAGIDGMIANGTASPLYGCTTTQQILDRLNGKTQSSTNQPSTAAASTTEALTKAGLW